MSIGNTRQESKLTVISRTPVRSEIPQNGQGKMLKVSQYFGENVFDLTSARGIGQETQKQLQQVVKGKAQLSKEMAKEVAQAVLDWAIDKGVTHFCHWFQPLTGSTAEKHDAFLSFDGDRAIEKLSASQLIQGEPDASSFPHGGSRSTFEARGYTTWDLTSPIFIKESSNGKTLCIPTAFVSYYGNALDIKTPLLRSTNVLKKEGTRFLNLTGTTDVSDVTITCGTEQEYFLVDKAFYFLREDLVMSDRTLLSGLTPRNQQLEDHYFGTIPERVLAFMQDCEVELYKLGIPAKTRHNEVAPGQFEIAPIFRDVNTAADNNQLLMATLKNVAEKHNMVCLFHEKPFSGINGSGKHLNWSMADENGKNFLEPGQTPQDNHRFLAMIAVVCEAVNRHAEILRAAIAGHGNDHRLGANEAPPSIMSVFLGDTIKKILDQMISGDTYSPDGASTLDIGAEQLAVLAKDNTDRNRTSPFAFTGNKFEFRAVGSSASVGFPLAILNAAVADVLKEANDRLETLISEGSDIPTALNTLTTELYKKSERVVFNGDGYSQEWQKEAESRGLSNLRTMADTFKEIKNEKYSKFLFDQGIYRQTEWETLTNVRLERYNKYREIEFLTLIRMVDRVTIPAVVRAKKELAETFEALDELKIVGEVEKTQIQELNSLGIEIQRIKTELKAGMEKLTSDDETEKSLLIANTLLPMAEQLGELSGEVEQKVAGEFWTIPTYFDLLFVR